MRILLATTLATALAQDPPSFRSNVEIAEVSCAVIDASGAPVRDLTRDDFQVFDNDVRRPITNFSTNSDQPLTLGVIIDASESQKEEIDEHRQTAADLLTRILHPGDRSFVVSVAEEVKLWIDVTENIGAIRKRLDEAPRQPFGEPCASRDSNIPGLGPVSACGASPLWNAVYDAAQIKLRALKGDKALLILTDGFDSGSTRAWNQAADAVSRSDATLYAIQYRSEFGGSFAPDLYRLVGQTGGTWFHAPQGDYERIVTRLENDLRGRYALGFRPEKLSGRRRHDVRIEVARPGVTVRARRTYFEDLR